MTPEQERFRKTAEKQILRAMLSKKLKFSLAKEAVCTGVTSAGAAYVYISGIPPALQIPTYVLTGLAALMLAETYSSIKHIRSISEKNKRLISALNNEEAPALEIMISLESELLVKQMSKEYSPEEKQAYKEISRSWNERPLEEQVEALAEEANSLIGYDISVPKIERSADFKPNQTGRYDYGQKIIIMPINRKAPVITLAHEYAHHIQGVKSCSKDWNLHHFLTEGFADAIALASVENYALKTGDKNMESDARCTRLHKLCFYRNIFRSPEMMKSGDRAMLADYYAGTAAFLVAEQKHGRGIYREILDSKNPHGLLVEMVCERSEVNLGTKQSEVTMVCGRQA